MSQDRESLEQPSQAQRSLDFGLVTETCRDAEGLFGKLLRDGVDQKLDKGLPVHRDDERQLRWLAGEVARAVVQDMTAQGSDFAVGPDRDYLGVRLEDVQTDPWGFLLDEAKSTAEREAALRLCVESDEDRAATFLAGELGRDDIPVEWQDTLVLCAETVQFHEDVIRKRLWLRLLEIATHRRMEADDAAAKPIVLSAIRCLTSMIPLEELHRLLPLLEPPSPLETRLVTLQCISNVFEAGPPTASDQFVQLCDRVYELALKFLDRDWLIAGERAAIGLNAFQALACLGDRRLATCVSQLRALRMDWFVRQAIRKLQEIVDAWKELDDCEAVSFVREQLSVLREMSASTN